MSAVALLRGQLAWFREQGWDVTLVSSPDEDAQRAVRREQVSFVGIPMKRNISLIHDLKSSLEWMRLIRRVRPDVVNVGTPKASLLGILSAWVHRTPRRIYTIRGLRLEGTSGPLEKLLWAMEKLTIAMATDVIAISPSLGKELVRRKLAAPQDIWIIGSGSSNGVDSDAIHKRVVNVDRDSLRQQLGIDPDKFVVGYIGRVVPSKGVDTLLEALQSDTLDENVEVLIVGSLDDSALKQKIDSLNSRVYVVPWTEDVWGYLPVIDLLCHPTLREGFGNVVVEAAAAGIPAITTRVTGAIDTVVNGKTGLHIDATDVEALVTTINLLAVDEGLRLRLGECARQRVWTDFKPADIWSGIEAVADSRRDVPQLKRLDQYSENGAEK